MLSESDLDILSELRESYHKDGPMHPAVKTQFGVACGNTRLKAVPEWPVEYRQVKDYYTHLKLAAADNIHESKSPMWWSNILAESARELMKQGVERNKVAQRLSQDFPISSRSVYRHLPDEFKGLQGPKGPREIASVANSVGDKLGVKVGSTSGVDGEVAEPAGTPTALDADVDVGGVEEYETPQRHDLGRREKTMLPHAGVDSAQTPHLREVSSYPAPRASEHRASSYTEDHTAFMKLLVAAGVKIQASEYEVVRDGENTADGRPKVFRVDILTDNDVAVEVDGEGHDYAGDSERDTFLESKGLHVVHVPNDEIKTQSALALVKMAGAVSRLRSSLRVSEAAEKTLLEEMRGCDAEKFRQENVELTGVVDRLRQRIGLLESSLNAALGELEKMKQAPTPDTSTTSLGGIQLTSDILTCSKCRAQYHLEDKGGRLSITLVGERKK